MTTRSATEAITELCSHSITACAITVITLDATRAEHALRLETSLSWLLLGIATTHLWIGMRHNRWWKAGFILLDAAARLAIAGTIASLR